MPLIEDAQQRLNALGVSFYGDSVTSLTLPISGRVSLDLTEESAQTFVYVDYVSVRSAANQDNQFLAQVVSFDRTSHLLVVDTITSEGTGTHADWKIRIGTPPETGHAERVDNPHATTASQVGAYTIAGADAAIAAAIAAMPPITTALIKAQNLADLNDKGAARINLGLGDLATATSVGSGQIAANLWATQAEAEGGVDGDSFSTPLRVAQQTTARIATQAEAEAGADTTKLMTPQRTKQAITAQSPVTVATQAEAEAGTENTKMMTALRVKQAINKDISNYLFRNLTADFGGSNDTEAQAWFSNNANVTLEASSSYRFEGLLLMTRASGGNAHTISFQWALGGSLFLNQMKGHAICNSGTGSAPDIAYSKQLDGNGPFVVKPSMSNSTEYVSLRIAGTLRTAAGGTLRPEFFYSAAPGGGPTIKAGTYLELTKIGDNAVESRGTWS
jgi:hypothetical protein